MESILNSLDPDSLKFINDGLVDFNFVNINGRNSLMIACMCGFFEKVVKIYEQNPELINLIDNFGHNALTISCCYNHEQISIYLIENKIDLNIITKDGFTSFIYSCNCGNVIVSRLILDKGFKNIYQKTFNGITALETIGSKNMYEISNRILNIEIDKIEDFKKFKIYKKSDFLEISYTETSHGTFGAIFSAITKDGDNILLKKFLKKEDRIINYSTIREIYFIKMLNQISKEITYKLYGIYIDEENNIYLVMEKLLYTLDVIYDKLNFFEYTNYYKKLFYDILILIHKMNMCGIIHNDLKHNNLMIDKFNKIKIIDFGFAEFLGIGPNSSLVDNYKATSFLKAPDQRKSYNSDIYSIGFLFLQAFFKQKMKKYVFIDDELNMYKNNNLIKLSIKKLKKIPHFLDLIKCMIDTSGISRFKTIDCLNHDFFSFEKISKSINLNKVDISNMEYNKKLSKSSFIKN